MLAMNEDNAYSLYLGYQQRTALALPWVCIIANQPVGAGQRRGGGVVGPCRGPKLGKSEERRVNP